MYAIIKCVNGAFSIHAEGFADIASAKVTFHDVCKTLWNAGDVTKATVMIVNGSLEYVAIETITH